jgi:hypothetical protein
MTISHPPVALEDVHLTTARKTLAELPDASANDEPYFWIGRLSAALADLVAVAAPGGMDAGQREVLGQALADAIAHRTPSGDCEECDTRPEGLCNEHAADLDLTDAYLALGRQLGIEVAPDER